jgi:hypothetical protein
MCGGDRAKVTVFLGTPNPGKKPVLLVIMYYGEEEKQNVNIMGSELY